MAQVGTAAARDPKPAANDADGDKADAPLLAKLNEFLRRYAPISAPPKDTLEDRYSIDLSAPLPELDNKIAKAFTASDNMEPSRLLYAHVCEPGSIPRHRAIGLLTGLESRFLVQLVASGPVTLSSNSEERFVIFYERPLGIKLSELMNRKRIPVNQAFIIEHILTPLANAIQQIGELDISHGLVNPDNIFISDIAMLGPCVSEPAGFSQPFIYESVERIQAMPAAKGEGSTAQDYYALAVTLLYILHGPGHFSVFNEESLVRALLRQGAYNALMLEKEVPEVFYDFFRGALTIGVEERWNSRQIAPWLAGKRYNVLPPPPPMDAVRPFEFGEQQANTRRELAHMFSKDWEHMVAALHNNQLSHWVSVSLRNKELSDVVSRLSRTAYDLSSKNEAQTSEALMNIVMLLDPYGPIRIKHLSMHIDGLDTLCANLYLNKANAELQILAKFIEANMVNYWLDLQNRIHKTGFEMPTAVNNINIRLDRLRGCIRNTGYGFGLERILYDLNPELPCVSPLLSNKYVTTLTNLLLQLDRAAPGLSDEEDPIDRHIAAFIASKLSIQHEIRLHDLAAVPALAASRTLTALYLLGMAQERADPVRLPGLTHWLVLRIIPMLSHIHSRTLREKLKAALMSYAPLGYLPRIAELLVTARHVADDHAAFQKALLTFHENAFAIESFQKAENIEYDSVRLGFNIARMVAYICMLGSFFLVMRLGA